jgi:hypothetical protein
MMNGTRGDYVSAPAYDFIDGRGTWLETPFGATDKQLIILKKEDGSREVIPYETEKFAIALDKEPKSIVALDFDYKEIKEGKGELKGGMFYIQPVLGAFSYRIVL